MIADPHQVRADHVADDHAVGVRIGDVVEVDLDRVVLQRHRVLHIDDLRRLRLPCQRVRRHLVFGLDQAGLDRLPDAMTIRRQTVEHPFGTLKAWMGSTHFLTRRSKRSVRK